MKDREPRVSRLLPLFLLLLSVVGHTDIISDLARKPDVLSAKLSPKGNYLGVLREQDDERTVVFFSFPSMKPLSVMQFPGRNEVGDFWWVNDDRVIASILFERDQFESELSWGELYGMNADGTKGEHLFGLRAGGDVNSMPRRTQVKRDEIGSAQLLDPLWDDPRHVLIEIVNWSRGYNLVVESARMDVYSGKLSDRKIGPASNAQIVADRKGQPRFAFSVSDSQEQVVHYRDPDTGQWEELSRTPYGDRKLIPQSLLDDGRIAVLYEPEGKPAGLYLMDPKTQEKVPVYQHERVDASPRFDWQDRIFGVRLDDGMPSFAITDAEHPLGALSAQLPKVFPDRYAAVVNSTHDFRLSVIGVEDDDHTTEYYLYDTASRQMSLLFDSRPWIDDGRLPTMRPVSFSARDGVVLQGYLSLPPGSDGKNLPLVLVPHGGPHGPRDYWGSGWESFIPASGYAMLQINYRGSGGYGTDFERSGFRKWTTAMQDDLTDGVKWAIAEGIADPERICIHGWSYGGFAAVMSIIREPDLYKCAIAGAGVYDQDEQYRNADFADQTRWGRKYMDKVIGPSEEDRRAASPMNYVDRIRTPLLLVHGTEDNRVPIEHAYHLIDAYRKAGRTPPELIELPKEFHSPNNPKNLERWYRATIQFIEQHIGKP